MKRLLKISFDLSLLSFVPVITWFLLGILVDANLINIFSLTYPLQFVYYILKSIFSTGANVCKARDNNDNAVMSGLFFGTVAAMIIYSALLLNIDKYISFMNMDVELYRIFAIYSVIDLFISMEFAMLLDKLYFEDENKLANKYSVLFNLLKFSGLIIPAIFIKNQWGIIISAIVPMTLFTIYAYIRNTNKFRLHLNILKCIKYDSVQLFNSIAFLLIYLFGLSNAFQYGEEYAIALTFISLITDTQWDTFEAIVTAATIDISKRTFNYKDHIKNSYKLLSILAASIFLMFSLLCWFYDLDIKITMIYLFFDLFNFLVYPLYRIKICYLQLEWSAFKITANKVSSSILRMALSLLNTPYCTGLGQIGSSIYQLVSITLFFYLNYKVDKNGNVYEKRIDDCSYRNSRI